MKAGQGTAPGGVDVVDHPSGVRHHSFFHGPDGERVYATVYGAATPARLGMLMCSPWGADGTKMLTWEHHLAHELAAGGVTTVVFNWPGTEDSEGDVGEVDLDRLAHSAVDTITATEARCDVPAWGILGLRFGAAPAAVAAVECRASHLVLVQPELDPAAHFADIERSSRRAQLGAAHPESWGFGHPHPIALARPEHATTVATALDAFTGRGAVVGYRMPAGPAVPSRFTHVSVWGDWRQPPRIDHGPLRIATRRFVLRAVRRRR